MDPLFWLYQDNFRTYNVSIARKLKSVNAAIYLSELAQRFKYHSEQSELISHEKHGDGWFYYTMEKCEERTALTIQEQRTARAHLERLGLIESIKFGVPGKLHFKVNQDEILVYFGFSNNISRNAESTNRMLQINKQDVANQQTPHIYKDRQEEREKENDDNEQEVVAVPSEFDSKFSYLQGVLEAAAQECNEKWRIPYKLLMSLAKKYGIYYLSDQVEYMFSIQLKAIRDENSMKSQRVKKIENPEVYLKLACEKNYAMTEKG